MLAFDPPIFLNCRDRIADLKNLIEWLERAGHQKIILLDNASTYEPLLEYYRHTPHDVVYLGENLGSRSIWRAGRQPSEFYVYSDPDILPIEQCPIDAISYLRDLLKMHPQPKAGLGLYLDDIPSIQSEAWERNLVAPSKAVRQGVYDSLVDTTLALYRPGTRHGLPALRTGFPYQIRHLPWYRLNDPTEEEQYYLERAIMGQFGSSWAEGRQ